MAIWIHSVNLSVTFINISVLKEKLFGVLPMSIETIKNTYDQCMASLSVFARECVFSYYKCGGCLK